MNLHSVTRFAGLYRVSAFSTGSRTHPWLHAVTRFAGSYRFRFLHGFADSPVATCRHPLRGFVSRFRFLHGFADSPVAT